MMNLEKRRRECRQVLLVILGNNIKHAYLHAPYSSLHKTFCSIDVQVTNLEDDLADGLIIRHLIESLSGEKLKMPFGEYVQSEERQQRNLKSILSQTEKIIEKVEQKTGYVQFNLLFRYELIRIVKITLLKMIVITFNIFYKQMVRGIHLFKKSTFNSTSTVGHCTFLPNKGQTLSRSSKGFKS